MLVVTSFSMHHKQVIGTGPCIAEAIKIVSFTLCPFQEVDGIAESGVPAA